MGSLTPLLDTILKASLRMRVIKYKARDVCCVRKRLALCDQSRRCAVCEQDRAWQPLRLREHRQRESDLLSRLNQVRQSSKTPGNL